MQLEHLVHYNIAKIILKNNLKRSVLQQKRIFLSLKSQQSGHIGTLCVKVHDVKHYLAFLNIVYSLIN